MNNALNGLQQQCIRAAINIEQWTMITMTMNNDYNDMNNDKNAPQYDNTIISMKILL